jgi:hypothetical protein
LVADDRDIVNPILPAWVGRDEALRAFGRSVRPVELVIARVRVLEGEKQVVTQDDEVSLNRGLVNRYGTLTLCSGFGIALGSGVRVLTTAGVIRTAGDGRHEDERSQYMEQEQSGGIDRVGSCAPRRH